VPVSGRVLARPPSPAGSVAVGTRVPTAELSPARPAAGARRGRAV